jgi:MFS superfamily sulfate permease-like transporter
MLDTLVYVLILLAAVLALLWVWWRYVNPAFPPRAQPFVMAAVGAVGIAAVVRELLRRGFFQTV